MAEDDERPRLEVIPGALDDSETGPSDVERMLAAMAPGTAALREAFTRDLPAMRRAFSHRPRAEPGQPEPPQR